MLVHEFMTPHPLTVNERTRVADARQQLRTHGIHAMPVIRESGELVGIITDRDLRETQTWLPLMTAGLPQDVRKAIDDCEVGVLMEPRPITVAPSAPLETAAEIMRTQRVGGLPVVANSEIVGIITETDILRAFEVCLGAGTRHHRTCVDLQDGAPLWQHLKLLADSGNPATHVVRYRARRGGHERALIRTSEPVGG